MEALRPSSERRSAKMLLLGALLGISPDFDYALNWLRISWGGWHHGFTHSIPFALVLGLVLIVIFKDWSVRSYLVFTLAYVSHTLLDFMFTESRGVALWWPFTNYRYKLRLPNPIEYTWRDSSLSQFLIDVLKLCLMELVIFGPILIAVLLIKHRTRAKDVLAAN
jgi:membrane-bound metal-dependent hydrolase YbcI (DUF457 family)